GAGGVKGAGGRRAVPRFLPRLHQAHPQLRLVLSLDSLYGVGPAFALAGQFGWPFVATFKEGRTPALWQEYRALLQASPQNRLRRAGGDGRVQEFRWVEPLDYPGSEGGGWQR